MCACSSFAQSQLERVTAASLSIDSLNTRLTALQAEVTHSSDRVQQLTRLLKLEQAYSAKVKEEINTRVADVEATVKQWREDDSHDRDEQRRQRDERDEMERRERVERQLRDVNVQAVVADMEERLIALQRQVDEDRRQREQDRREADDSRQQMGTALSTITQRVDDTTSRTEALVRMIATMDERNRADDERRSHNEQQWQLDMTATKEQQRTQLLKCVSDLRSFQLSVRDEMGRRERQAEVVKKAVLVMSEEMDRRAGANGDDGVAGVEVRRWREDERRKADERERRRQREEMDKVRDDVYRYIDARITSLPAPQPLQPMPPQARPTSGFERPRPTNRQDRVRGVDDARWVERSMEQLVDELTVERAREPLKLATERGVSGDGSRGRSIAATATQGGYRTTGVSGGNGAVPISVRQRGAPQINLGHRPTRAGLGR